MARIELAAGLAEDIERIVEHLETHEVEHVSTRLGEIIKAIAVLEDNPLIGRPVRRSLRELIIGRDSRGYVALYHYVEALDTVFVLALRHQREAGYARD